MHQLGAARDDVAVVAGRVVRVVRKRQETELAEMRLGVRHGEYLQVTSLFNHGHGGSLLNHGGQQT